MLQYQLEQFSPGQEIESSLLIYRGWYSLQLVLDPAAAGWVGDVHELGADGAAVNPSRLFGVLTLDLQIGMRHRLQKSERVEVGFEVSPLAEGIEHTFARAIPIFG